MTEGDYYLTHYGALFGTAEGATFQNITMKDGEVRVAKNEFRSAYAASLVAWAQDTTFLYCHNYNNVYCEYAGGIVSYLASGSVTGCTNRGEIAPLNSDDSTTYGGIIAKTPENNDAVITITKCANYGRIYSGTDSSLYCGGIIGSSYSPNTVIDNCANTADIGASTSVMSGGIVGTAIGTSISYCYNTGNISGGGAGGILGGILFICLGKFPAGFGILGCALVCGGLSILTFYACKYITIAMAWLTKKIALFIKKCFTKKEEK